MMPKKSWAKGQAELAATPEAQIPECVLTVESLAMERDQLRVERDAIQQEYDGFRRETVLIFGEHHTKVAALRVERDQAWNEAIEHAAGQFDGGWDPWLSDEVAEKVRSLARDGQGGKMKHPRMMNAGDILRNWDRLWRDYPRFMNRLKRAIQAYAKPPKETQ